MGDLVGLNGEPLEAGMLEDVTPPAPPTLKEVETRVAAVIEEDFDEDGYLTSETRDFRVFAVDINLGLPHTLSRTIPATAQMIQVRSTRDVAGGQEITLVFMESALSESEKKGYAEQKVFVNMQKEAAEAAKEEVENDE